MARAAAGGRRRRSAPRPADERSTGGCTRLSGARRVGVARQRERRRSLRGAARRCSAVSTTWPRISARAFAPTLGDDFAAAAAEERSHEARGRRGDGGGDGVAPRRRRCVADGRLAVPLLSAVPPKAPPGRRRRRPPALGRSPSERRGPRTPLQGVVPFAVAAVRGAAPTPPRDASANRERGGGRRAPPMTPTPVHDPPPSRRCCRRARGAPRAAAVPDVDAAAISIRRARRAGSACEESVHLPIYSARPALPSLVRARARAFTGSTPDDESARQQLGPPAWRRGFGTSGRRASRPPCYARTSRRRGDSRATGRRPPRVRTRRGCALRV